MLRVYGKETDRGRKGVGKGEAGRENGVTFLKRETPPCFWPTFK